MRCPVTNELLVRDYKTYEEYTFNLASTYRYEKMGGLEYLVVKSSMLVPGVLNGSQGPLYYPVDEVSRNVQAWNMMPLTFGHPTDNGRAVSARDPKVLEQYGLGFVFNATTGKSGSLIAEAWFDVVRTKTIAPTIIDNILAQKPIELSTGLFTDNHPVKNKTFRGRPYDAVARNYRPDHLAILLGTRGACSVDDGCGVGVTNKESDSVRLFNNVCLFRTPCPYSS